MSGLKELQKKWQEAARDNFYRSDDRAFYQGLADSLSPHIEHMEALRHVGNEWADAATNGLQWIKNIRDGISAPEEAIAALENDIKHARSILGAKEEG